MKTLKKSLALLLAFSMVLSLMSVSVFASGETENPTVPVVSGESQGAYTITHGEDTYEHLYQVVDGFYQDGEKYDSTSNFYITNKDGLKYFRDWVNGTSDAWNTYEGFLNLTPASFASNNGMAGKNVHLLADIDLTGEVWQPIGPNSGAVSDKFANNWKAHFYGSFYGHNHVVSNMDTSESDQGDKYSRWPQGFFGSITQDATIEGLILENVKSVSKYWGGYAGAIVGDYGSNASNSLKISDCVVKGRIEIEGGNAGAIYGIGGGNVINCQVIADEGSTITGNSFAGALVGAERVGSTTDLKINNNSVSGVSISGNCAGKLVGSPASGAAGTLTITGNTVDETVAVSGTHTDDYICEKVQPYTTVIITDRPVAQIGETKYTTLAESIDAAQDGNTITLLADVDITSAVSVSKTLTLDTNGKTITNVNAKDGTRAIRVESGATLTVNGGGYFVAGEGNSTGDNSSLIDVYGTLIVDGASFTSANTCIGTSASTAVVTINNATMNAKSGGSCLLAAHGGRIDVYGLTFYGDKDDAEGSGCAWAGGYGSGNTGTVNIFGGIFYSAPLTREPLLPGEVLNTNYCLYDYHDAVMYNPSYFTAGNIIVYGGTFEGFDPSGVNNTEGTSNYQHSYVADGYVAVKTGEVWVVTQLKPAGEEGNQTTTTNSTSETTVKNEETKKTTATTTDTTVEQTLTSGGDLVSKTTTTEDLATTTDVNNVVTEVKYTATTKAETVGETSTETVASATVKSETKAGGTELGDTDAAALAEKASNTIPADQVALAEELKETAETYKAQNPTAEKVEVEVTLEIRTTLTDYEAGSKVTYEVAPWKTTVVKVNNQPVEAEPAAQKVANTELSENAEITIRLPIPDNFGATAASKINVKHSSEDFDDDVIAADVVDSSGTLYAEFPVEHFSSFEILPVGTAYHTVTFDSGEGGSKVNAQKVVNNGTATRPANPTRSGYTFTGWTLGGSAYNFATPVTGGITLDAQWTRNSTGGSYTPPTTTITDEETPLSEFPIFYVDVAENAWYHDAIAYVTALELMNGVGDDRFAPNANTTRGMVAVVMMRLAQGVAIDSESFFDVADDAYYAEAAAWAVENGVYVGFDDGSFRGELNILREQFAAVLYRYATAKGYDVSGKAGLGSFTDSASVSGYAADAMAWAVESGIIEGVGDNLLDPLGNATRAQLATMLMRFHALYTAEV